MLVRIRVSVKVEVRVEVKAKVWVRVRVRVCGVLSSSQLGMGCAVGRWPLVGPPEEYPWAHARCVRGYAGGAAAEQSG